MGHFDGSFRVILKRPQLNPSAFKYSYGIALNILTCFVFLNGILNQGEHKSNIFQHKPGANHKTNIMRQLPSCVPYNSLWEKGSAYDLHLPKSTIFLSNLLLQFGPNLYSKKKVHPP